jgi:hypothetical protein
MAPVFLHLLFAAPVLAGEPVAGVDILIRSKSDGRIVVQTITDGRGSIVIKEMRPGPYSVEAGSKLPAALIRRSASWGIALIPVSTKTAKPQNHRTKPTAQGMQVDIVVPDGAPITFTVIVTY